MNFCAAPGRTRARRIALSAGAVVASALFVPPPAQPSSEPLLWPTTVGTCLTSTFGEWREGHFHSGADVSTGGKTGVPVVAVADGDVVRLRVSCRGYGRAIYLRMKDGRTAVYAHLEAFEGALADTARAIQRRQGSALFDREISAGALPVRRGQRIGRTGQSGAGPPHLHFELRDAQERALDPLAHGLHAPDSKPPRITRIALTPLTPESSVDGDSKAVVLGVNRGKDGTLAAARTVAVEGRIGIAVESKDGVDACDRAMAPKRWEILERDSTLFAVETDRFTFDEWGQVDLQFDSRYSYRGAGDFVRLWRRPGNAFPSSAGNWPSADGVEVPAKRTFTIAAIDAAGNRTEASLVLAPAGGAATRASKSEGAADSLRGGVLASTIETRGSWLEVRFPRVASSTRIRLAGDGAFAGVPYPAGAGRRFAFAPLGPRGTAIEAVVTDAAGVERAIPIVLPGLACRAGEAGSIASRDSTVTVRFPAGTLREDTFALLEERSTRHHSRELRPVGPQHQLDTGYVPLAGEVEITIRPPADFDGDPDRLAVFVQVGDRFRYIGGGNGRGEYVGSTQRPRPFGLFEDTAPPSIGPVKIVRRSGAWCAELRVSDAGAGVDCDDVRVIDGGRVLLHEYDGETGDVIAELEDSPAAGASRAIRVEASDRVGNRSEREERVTARPR